MTAWSSRANSAAALAAPLGSVRYWPIAVLVVAALTLVRYATLQASPLNLLPDEAQYWAWAQSLDFGYFSKPPMIAWLIAATTGLCGDGEACVRAASPLMHGLTALLVFALGKELADDRVAFWSSVGYATLPGVSFSALLMSTDVPLLLFWAAALLAFVRWLKTGQAGWAVALGVAVGLGLLSKYAMAYFILCAALYLAVSKEGRASLRKRQALLATAIAAALFVPNLLWNLLNGWPTVEHTAANANWSAELFNPGEAVEFAAAQFGVFGPILLIALVWRYLAAARAGLSVPEQLLTCFSAPVLLVVLLQAFISRAHANWAAPAHIAAVVLVTGWLLSSDRRRMLAVLSVAIHTVFAVILYSYVSGAAALDLPRRIDPIFSRQRGWDLLGQAVQEEAQARPGWTLMADERKLMAELVYYTRRQGTAVAMWDYDRPARNFFEATARIHGEAGEKVLLVTAEQNPGEITKRFRDSRRLRTIEIRVGPARVKVWHLFELEGLRPT